MVGVGVMVGVEVMVGVLVIVGVSVGEDVNVGVDVSVGVFVNVIVGDGDGRKELQDWRKMETPNINRPVGIHRKLFMGKGF
jgi:hypothetical protein